MQSQPAVPEAQENKRKARSHTVLLWIAFAAFILFMRWPVAKGLSHHASSETAVHDGIVWQTDYNAALKESAQSGKPVLLDFSATWCPPCEAMREDVWTDARVTKLANSKFIPVALDADAPATIAPAQKYNVETIPRILIVDAKGNVLKDGSYMDADEMVSFLSESAQAVH